MSANVAATRPAEAAVARPRLQQVQPPDFGAEETPEADKHLKVSSKRLYLGFLVVGCSAGWLLWDNVYISFGASYAGVQDSNFYGAASLITGAVSLGLALLFLLFQALRPRGLSRRAAQLAVGLIIVLTMVGHVILAPWWSVQDEEGNYPVLLAVFAMGTVVVTMTYFVAFPLVTTHYGGWLVAPFRAGTDMSLLVCALVSQVQSPLGGMGPHLFPAWVVQVIYVGLTAVGLSIWAAIVRTGSGLRKAEEQPQQEEVEADAKPERAMTGPTGLLGSLACPRSLLGPVLVGGVLSHVNYWALALPIGDNSSKMTDPFSCDGDTASAMFKVATTASFCLVPVASMLSGLGRCPRPIFYGLFALQCLCVLALWLSLRGVGRETFWSTELGSAVWGVAYSLTGGLEGYLLTMTYRYVGDDPGVDSQARATASNLVSFLGVMARNGLSLAIGLYMVEGGLACVEP